MNNVIMVFRGQHKPTVRIGYLDDLGYDLFRAFPFDPPDWLPEHADEVTIKTIDTWAKDQVQWGYARVVPTRPPATRADADSLRDALASAAPPMVPQDRAALGRAIERGLSRAWTGDDDFDHVYWEEGDE